MSSPLLTTVATIVAVAAASYLVYTLIRPERF